MGTLFKSRKRKQLLVSIWHAAAFLATVVLWIYISQLLTSLLPARLVIGCVGAFITMMLHRKYLMPYWSRWIEE